MKRSDLDTFMLSLFIGNIALIVFGISQWYSGQLSYDQNKVLIFPLSFQIVNTIFFIYFSHRHVKIHNSKDEIKEIASKINEENISRIISEMLTNEIKQECLNDYKGLKVQSLVHEAKKRVLEKKK